MYDLTIIKQNGRAYIDSRDVAAAVGKRHDHLLRDIRNYVDIIKKRGLPKIGVSDFFIESNFKNSQNKSMPCYLISKLGAEVIANKLTGEKGTLFTIAYVSKFNMMETVERAELKSRSAMPIPRLGEYNATTRIIVRSLQNLGMTPDRIITFIKSVYEPLGFTVAENDEIARIPQMYTAKQIAAMLGVYSINGNPHYQAVSCILNENLLIEPEHKDVITTNYGNRISMNIRYDKSAVSAVENWLFKTEFPNEIYGFERTYHVLYRA